MARILAVDDDDAILSILKTGLEKDGHRVQCESNPQHIAIANAGKFDLIILDIMMPGIDGIELVSRIRQVTDSPILFLTAKTQVQDIQTGLSAGADDYLTKPFDINELRSRIQAHLRREQRDHALWMTVGSFRFDLSSQTVYFQDKPVHLTPGEFGICQFLANNHGHIFSRDQIYDAVFDYADCGQTNSIATHIKNIRLKFARFHVDPIVTRWGIGYLWQS